ncbi:major capsid protein [Rhodovulum tesquicola]|uniref:major capsid protein n=1 Tax=Rhodovulum tesquicola TaxID=540254 RepID=UPI0020974149|nr:major capsid protein [Rhodovulum tesquicola]MCO8146855.1 major capsid protein [Rhodovulum tesquicola]
MSSLNTNTARVIDPVLSGIAQGYRHAQRVGHILFPAVDVMARGGRVIEFGRESFANYKARRAPGADAVCIQFGYEGKPFSLDQYSLDAPVPREHSEDAQTVPGIDLGKRAVNLVMDALTLTLEIEQAELALDPANYPEDNILPLAGSTCWNSAATDPIMDIEEAKERVRTTCGVDPNRMVVSSAGFRALKNHPRTIERFKYTTSESITAKMLAGLFELDELAVGKATYVDSDAPDAPFKEAWGNAAVLAYVPTQDAALEQPSFGYTYTLKGHPFVEPPRWEGGRRSWVYGVTYERKPVLTGIASGFLFQNIVEPA